MQKHRKFIGNKRFYLMVLGVAMPIMIQNGITNFVSLLDNIMVGQVGTEQMSGVAIVNQLLFIYNLCIFGGVSGAGIFTAQYFGQGNDEGVRNTFRFKLWIGVILTAAAIFIVEVAMFMPVNAFLHASYFTLRSGGKTIITFLFDSVFIWVVSVPVAFCLSRFTGLSIYAIYFMVMSVDLIKCVIGFVLVKKGVWLQNIVAE